MNRAPGFTMPSDERMKFSDLTLLCSMPMYALYGQLRIDEIPFERLTIKLKDHKNLEHIKQVKKAIT